MTIYRYQLETCEAIKLQSPQRTKVKLCPCGRNNKDGKFVPFAGYDDRGYCHSCSRTFAVGKHNCPSCGQKAAFNRYIDTENADCYLSAEVGKCIVCGYHLPPREYAGKPNSTPQYKPTPQPPQPPPARPTDYIPLAILERALNDYRGLYDANHFIQWLTNESRGLYAFTDDIVKELIESYYLGNAAKYPGWVLFPYIDHKWRLRQIKLMDYDPTTGSRIKEPKSRVLAIGKKVLNNEDANLQYCLFGEHLLNGNSKPVKIFESEATAIYCSVFFPAAVCLATGGKHGFKFQAENLHPLRGRQITLYPDLEAHSTWEQKAADLQAMGLNVAVSTALMEQATQYALKHGIDPEQMRKNTFDLRDVLKFQDWRPYRNSSPATVEVCSPPDTPEPPRGEVAPEMDEVTKRAVSLLLSAGFELMET